MPTDDRTQPTDLGMHNCPPGGELARRMGCTCDVVANNPVRGTGAEMHFSRAKHFMVAVDCPVHKIKIVKR